VDQVDASRRAVVAGLSMRAVGPPNRTFGALAEEASPILTPREIEVLAAISDGLTNKAVARRLGISPHTVKFHIESLFRDTRGQPHHFQGRDQPHRCRLARRSRRQGAKAADRRKKSHLAREV